VRSTRRRTSTVAADRDCRHSAVGLQRREGMARFADAPDPNRPVLSGADDTAVLSERDGCDCDVARLVTEEIEIRLHAGVPEARGSVCTCRGDGLSVRTECNVR